MTQQCAPATPFDPRRPFTSTAARAAGITRRQLAGPVYRRIFRDVYVAADVLDSAVLRARAALLPFGDDAFVSHVTAARLRGVPVPTLPDEHVTVGSAAGRRNRSGIRCHVARRSDVEVVHGVRASSAGGMFVELVDLLSLVDLAVVGDHLVRNGLISIPRLRLAAARSPRARAAAAYVRARVDSPMETRLRMLLVLAGLPEPEVNLTIRDVYGQPLRRYDLCWPAARVIVEYDGRHHVEREAQWESDLERREAIDDDGWRLLVVIARGIYSRPDLTVQRVWRVLSARGLTGLPARPSDEWRPHFPVRAAAA